MKKKCGKPRDSRCARASYVRLKMLSGSARIVQVNAHHYILVFNREKTGSDKPVNQNRIRSIGGAERDFHYQFSHEFENRTSSPMLSDKGCGVR